MPSEMDVVLRSMVDGLLFEINVEANHYWDNEPLKLNVRFDTVGCGSMGYYNFSATVYKVTAQSSRTTRKRVFGRITGELQLRAGAREGYVYIPVKLLGELSHYSENNLSALIYQVRVA